MLVNLSNIWAVLVASGPVAVFLIFLSPFGPGAVAGILLARSQHLAPALTIGLYALSDVIAAIVLEPFVRWLPRFAGRSPLGQRLLATFTRIDTLTDIIGGRFGRPIGLATFTFATDFFTAAVVSTGLVISRLVAWGCIIFGDVLWFVIIYAASMSVASFLTDNRLVFIFSLVLGFGLPAAIRRIIYWRRGRHRGPREYVVDSSTAATGAERSDQPSARPAPRELGCD